MKRMEGIPGAKATKIVGFGLWKNKVWNWNIRVNLQAAHLSDLIESYILWLQIEAMRVDSQMRKLRLKECISK